MTAPQELLTTRLLLRSFGPEDIPALVRLAGAREIAAQTANIPHPYSEEDARNFLAKAAEEFRAGRAAVFAVSIPPGRELRGAAGLHMQEAHKRAELGYWIGVPDWGKGYATETASALVAFGFGTLKLHRVYAHVHSGNSASQRVLEKIGMRHEGRSRQHVLKWDRFIDIENYGMVAEDFEAGRIARRGE